MAENEITTTPDATKEEVQAPIEPIGKTISAGTPQPANMASLTNLSTSFGDPVGQVEPPTQDSTATIPNTNIPATTVSDTPQFTDDHFKAFLESKGIAFDGDMNLLKEKLTGQTAATEITPEQKASNDKAYDKMMLDYYMENFEGTPEQFVALKNVASSDLTQLSVSELKRELKEQKFSDEEIDLIVKERYYQIADEDLEQYDDEEEKDFLKRKKEYGAKKLANRSSYIQKQAQEILDTLKDGISAKDLQKKAEKEFSSKVDEHLGTIQRKVTFELGKVNDHDIAPIVYDVTDAELSEVSDILKDPAKRQQYFLNSDSNAIPKVAELLVRNKILEGALKGAYLEGGTRQVSKFEEVFPNSSPHALGVGGAPFKTHNGKGKLTSYGKPVVVPKNN